MQDLKVGMVQTFQNWEDKSANIAHFEQLFSDHLIGKEMDLLLLPEMFNTGFTMNAPELAEEMNGESVKWLISWAARLNCKIGGSLIIVEDGNYFNRFVIVDQEKVLTHYDKRHLFRMAEEHKHYSAGQKRVIYTLNGWRINLQTCYDLRFPVFSRNQTINGKKEYDLLLYIANWPEKRNNVWKTLLKARAMENQAFCVGVNRIGTDGNDISYSGDSMAIDPWGNPIDQFAENQEIVKILTLDYSILEHLNERFPAYKDSDSFEISL